MIQCKSTAEEVSFEWSYHRILSTDSKVRTTLHVSIIDSGSRKVKADNWSCPEGVWLIESSLHIITRKKGAKYSYCNKI